MIYEWYRGSDQSQAVPKRLSELEKNEPPLPWDERVKVLRGLLAIEEEPNCRAYMLWRIGREYADEGRQQEAIAAFLEAKSEFDPLLGSVVSVMHAYCDTLDFLITWNYYESGDMETVAALSLSIVANLKDARLDDGSVGMAFFYQGKALSTLARKYNLPWLQPLALASYLRWHHEAPEDEACLEHLAYAYFRAGDMPHCRSAVEMCLEVAPAGEVRDRMEEFSREHVRELDPASGAS